MCKTLIEGRVQIVLVDGISYLNIYHKRVSNKKDLNPRIAYDIMFLGVVDKLLGPMVMLGDMNSVHHLHDTMKNIKVVEDPERSKPPLGWDPSKDIDPLRGSYERQFMCYLTERYNLIDIGLGKGFTFYKRDNPCMRIDYCLVRGMGVKSYDLCKTPVSDHVMMSVEI
jgi:endonuclease/exonuclease/phosphatase family metal-dependent hydrolase